MLFLSYLKLLLIKCVLRRNNIIALEVKDILIISLNIILLVPCKKNVSLQASNAYSTLFFLSLRKCPKLLQIVSHVFWIT